jgi:hypothetical protein
MLAGISHTHFTHNTVRAVVGTGRMPYLWMAWISYYESYRVDIFAKYKRCPCEINPCRHRTHSNRFASQYSCTEAPGQLGRGTQCSTIVESDTYFLLLRSASAPRPSRASVAGSGTTTVVIPSANVASTLPRTPSPAISPAPA